MSIQSLYKQPLSPEALANVKAPASPLAGIPELVFTPESGGSVPDDNDCERLWDKYEMLDNVRAHSRVVAIVATVLAEYAVSRGLPVKVAEVRASAMLHDIAKSYCLRHGGGHAQMGASWVVQETQNHAIARGVFHHVYWLWALPVDDPERMCSLPFFVMYADKRSRHDQFVTLEERFEDLNVRYGDTAKRREGIYASFLQAKGVEAGLSRHLGCDLSRIVL